ncbi:hypothetical protein [Streptomyces rubrogriseus]|uniref:Uncharacterized protein n=1 Tax=Streptomyces rubrogriseus TaxID=194673 RepID=A0A6G3TN94_9ACTN|nr:hypothetical protein [Streptomyces rubrogriseus]NEC38197.1 hypothetical protein [Streptomyces rubrogriseus]
MRIPDGVRRTVNVVLCLAAVVAIGWSGREIWLVWNNHRQIDAACGGLVPAGRVLDLSEAGGTITHRKLDDGSFDPDTGIPHDCEIFSTEAGERAGTDTGTRWFFTGAMGVLPAGQPRIADAPRNGPLDILGRATYPPQPLGGDIAGRVTDSSVTVQLPCEEGTTEDKSVRALWARAELMPRRGSQVSGHDRDVLADTAVETANNLADRLGCADRLPDAPDHVPALTAGPVPAARAEGTCAWYGKTGLAGRSPYPDEVIESRTDGRVWDESCGLVLSLGHADRVYAKLADAHDWLSTPDTPGEWFVSLHTYTGPVAENLQLASTDDGETPEPAVPGKAGRGATDPVWWASSVCDGRPQVHTMTLGHPGYAKLVASRMEDVFRAYVDDVTTRRHCADVVFPGHDTFRADWGES